MERERDSGVKGAQLYPDYKREFSTECQTCKLCIPWHTMTHTHTQGLSLTHAKRNMQLLQTSLQSIFFNTGLEWLRRIDVRSSCRMNLVVSNLLRINLPHTHRTLKHTHSGHVSCNGEVNQSEQRGSLCIELEQTLAPALSLALDSVSSLCVSICCSVERKPPPLCPCSPVASTDHNLIGLM